MQMNTRAESYRRKLLYALESRHPFPIDLEWLVELFKYKHISSLHTHLKRHFREGREYTKHVEPQNKKAWSYHISVECFRRICYFGRHSERKVVAKYWLKKLAARDKRLFLYQGALRRARESSRVSNEGSEEDELISDYCCSDTDGSSDKDTEGELESEPHSVRATNCSTPIVNSQRTFGSVLPQVLHPFNFFFHDWSYLKLCPLSHYMLFYYPVSNYYHDKSTKYNCTSPSNDAISQNGVTGNYKEEVASEAEASFDTNAFLSFPDEQPGDTVEFDTSTHT
jgi:hypothetical protein